jgi:putative colanic acid biosynthesis glycosyltransferase WcaI
MTTMPKPGKIVVASQYYVPDPSTTSVYFTAIAEGLAADRPVVVLSGSSDSRSDAGADQKKPTVFEIPNWTPPKDALIRRAIAVSLFALRMFLATLTQARRNDIVFCVTNPFTLPYAVMSAAKLRGAATALLIYDLYPEVLERAELIKPRSLTARLIRLANTILFRSLDTIITIGRDVGPLLLAYKGVTPGKISFIPNWTLLPSGYREVSPDNRFRAGRHSQLIVGLSGNLGFTHSPRTVYEAARLLQQEKDIHLVLSGWGVGWKQLCDLEAVDKLDNVTLLEPVPETELVEFLSAGDVWIIPYRRNVAGVSVPSRLYNLLAVGRAVIVAAESFSEAAMVIDEEDIGWVVPPEDPRQLADAIRLAAADRAATMQKGRRAAEAAGKYSPDTAINHYRDVLLKLRPRS